MNPTRESVRNWLIATFIVFILGAGVWTAVRNTSQIRSLQSGATANRVQNVLTWCSAINTDRDVTKAYVKAAGAPPLNLPDLPCRAIAYRTKQSNK